MAYSPLQLTKPSGADIGSTFATDTLRNDLALADAIALGALLKDFLYSVTVGTGDAKRPQYVYLKNGTRWVRLNLTWGTSAGAKYNVTAATMELSTNSGGVYDTVASFTATYDANGNVTATTGAGSFVMMLFSLLGHFWRQVDLYDAHVASTTAHSMLSMAQQAATAVAITGGTIVTPTQNLTMPAGAALGTKNGAFNIDLSLSHYFTVTIQAGAVATFTNKPASGTVKGFTLKITNGGLVADQTLFPGCQAPGGALALSSAGTDLLHGMIADGSTIMFTGVSPAIATLA
jgi:hypothetical protein